MSDNKERRETNRRLRDAQAGIQHLIDMFGDRLAKERGYAHHGIEAVWFYLVEKYHWPPATVRALNTDDLHFLLANELRDAPKGER